VSASAPPIQVIVGLGNPGPEYLRTRHNAGFWFVDALAQRLGALLRPESRFSGELCRVVIEDHECRLLKPMTFMNRSGQAVRALVGFFKVLPESVLIVHDDLDLPAGTARLKRGGGHGGHNGLRDIMAQLGSREFARLRLGVGHPGHRNDVVDHVLTRARAGEEDAILGAIGAALDVTADLVGGDWDRAVRTLHSGR
jgi:PTH1 family peptidyl-tRNA hydrolase